MSEEKEMESCECRHTQRTEKERKILMTRLKTVEGQIRGIEKWWKMMPTALTSSCRYLPSPMR